MLDVAGAGVSLGEADRVRFVTGVGEAVMRVEEVQETAQEGPCTEAYLHGKVITVPDLREITGKWDNYRPAARVLADMATSYIINASELEKAQRTTEQLQEALDSRLVIEQAKGILAADGRLGIDQGYQVLRRHVRSHNASLRSVADAVVNLGLRPT